MKFAISAVVMLALAVGTHSSLLAGIPGIYGHGAAIGHPGPLLAQGPALLGAHGLSAHGLGVHGLGVHGLGVHGLGVHGLGVHGLGVHGLPAAVNIAASPLAHAAAHIPAAVAVAPHAVAALPAHSATYVAKTRGALHTAPLPGHIQSAASVNVAPAPGTW